MAKPLYWRGPPKLREIEYRIIPDDNTILTQLKTHEIDFEYAGSSSQAPSLKNIPGTHWLQTPFTSYSMLALNTSRPLLTDVRVRQALDFATDKQGFVDKVTHGVNTIGDSDQPSFLWAYCSKAVDAAERAALAEYDQAGAQDRIRCDPGASCGRRAGHRSLVHAAARRIQHRL